MPKPSFPPTPSASLDLTGKNAANAPQLENGFTLPPAALKSNRGSVASSSAPSESASDSSYRPLSPSSPVASSKPSNARKRSSTTAQQSVVTKDDYSLPPPPTRSHKIIQMKPKDTQETTKARPQTQSAKATTIPSTTTGTKRKQSSNTSAAGRKIARKTAHSLIERRRRSKMNEEFGVLKDMIPACRGQEMHKLAILQASIEYMRYLETCVANLKAANRRDSPSSAVSETAPPPLRRMRDEDDEEDEDEDEEMEDAVSPTYVDSTIPKSTYHVSDPPSDRRSVCSHSTTTSPAILPRDDRGHYSANPSPALQPSDPYHYSLGSASIHSTITSPSIHPSPAFSAHTPSATLFSNPFHNGPPSTGPVAAPGSSHGAAPFSLGPPADREDHEATEALLMLNTDRRSWSGARGMSVKDLLSG
ncbi:hypothetical protein CC86DRAFT_399483 [Ophiobolus disseminans]|uniref:BHLH domain-containing protein n=1 Tax=Ophiobolus disseminans TaxID=1469910 RepID=A0A6A7AJC9_9PLEO|nr:hypothetical protein CC86DRAFT_399483 [Ophiobolus disseminans]